MRIVPARCTECGEILRADEEKDTAVCPHFRTLFFIEKNTGSNTRNTEQHGFEIRAGELIKYSGTAADAVIPDNVTYIGAGAFMNCIGLRSAAVPESVTHIGDRAFFGCSNLTSIDIPDSVTSIGYRAFSGCLSLTSITVPDSITSISHSTFSGCLSLTSITLPDSVEYIGADAFAGCSELISTAYSRKPDIQKSHVPADEASDRQRNLDNLKRLLQTILQKKRKDQRLCIHCGGQLYVFLEECKKNAEAQIRLSRDEYCSFLFMNTGKSAEIKCMFRHCKGLHYTAV